MNSPAPNDKSYCYFKKNRHLSPWRLMEETEVVKEGQEGGQGGEAEEGRQVMGEEEDT